MIYFTFIYDLFYTYLYFLFRYFMQKLRYSLEVTKLAFKAMLFYVIY